MGLGNLSMAQGPTATARSTTEDARASSDRATAEAEIAARDAAEEDGDSEIDTTVEVVRGAEEGAADTTPPPGVEFEDDGRLAMAKAISDAREARITKGLDAEDSETDEGDEPEDTGVIEAAPTAAATATTETAKPTAPAKVRATELAPDSVVVVKVNGKDVEVSLADLAGNYQKYVAGEEIFQRGKAMLDEARRSRSGEATTEDQNSRPGDQSQVERRGTAQEGQRTAKPTAAERKAKLLELARTLQTGTEEEAAEALDELDRLSQPAAGVVTQDQAVRLVHQAVASSRIDEAAEAEANQAVTDFAMKHAALAAEDDLAPAVLTAGYNVAVEALKKIGVPDEDFQRSTPRDVLQSYARLRQDPRYRAQLPSMSDLYDGVAQHYETRYGIQAGPPPEHGDAATGQNRAAGQPVVRATQERVVRKQTITSQPRPATIRSEAPNPNAAKPRNASDTIAKMAADREAGIAVRH